MLQELRNIFRPVMWSLILTIIIGTVSTLSTVSLMGLSAWLIASAALQPPLYVLSLAIVGVRFCGIMRAVFRYLERYLTHNLGFKLFTKFRVLVITKVINSLPFKRKTANGDVFDLIANAVDSLRDSALRFFLPPIIVSSCVVIIAIWCSLYSYSMMILLLSAWFLFMFVIPYIAWQTYQKLIKYKFALNEEILEMFEGNTELLVYNYATYRLNFVERAINEYQMYQQQLAKIKLKINFISEILLGGYITICVAIAIYLVNMQGLNAIIVITMILTIQAVIEALVVIPALLEYIHEAVLRWQEIVPYLKEDKKSISINKTLCNNTKEEYELILDKVSYGYDDVLIKNLDLSIIKGQKTLIVGASGCGKSTLFYVLTRLLYPLDGKIILNNKDYDTLDEESIRKNYAVAMQEHHIFNLTIRENFQMLYETITDEEIYKALAKVYLLDFVQKVGLDYKLVNNGSNLSGGQKHRLQLAICLAKQKDIILLDEPTAGLDIETANNICKEIIENYIEKTIIVSSHDISLLNYFDNIVVLEAGKVVEQGEIKTLLENKKSYLTKMVKYRNLV